jgi:hypothetical protein
MGVVDSNSQKLEITLEALKLEPITQQLTQNWE